MPTSTPLRSEFRFGASELPNEYAHPPLIEAWLGVEFDASADFAQVDVKDWRQKLGPEWPAKWQTIGAAERHAPGLEQIENQIRNVMFDRAIRFSSHGFSYGWLGHEGSRYPRYEALRDGFVATLDAVREVMPQVGSPIQTTVSYLNRIPQGTAWSSIDDLSFFRLWQSNPLQRLKIEAEGFAGRWQFHLDGERGLLTVELTHEPAKDDLLEGDSLWLRITATGPTDMDEASLFDGLDYGREVVVRAFNELVSTDAKDYWGVAPRKKSGTSLGKLSGHDEK